MVGILIVVIYLNSFHCQPLLFFSFDNIDPATSLYGLPMEKQFCDSNGGGPVVCYPQSHWKLVKLKKTP